MVPDTYIAYFTAAATAAGALIGLLFVAIALRPDTIFGPDAPPSGRALAGSAFTALVNAFFISLLALLPHVELGVAAIIMAVSSLVATVRLQRSIGHLPGRVPVTVFSIATYCLQLILGIALAIRPHNTGLVSGLAGITFAAFAVALARAWSLVEGSHMRPK